MSRSLLVLIPIALGAGCGDDDAVATDASVATDAGFRTDSGAEDAGGPDDAGIPDDAGSLDDAGNPDAAMETLSFETDVYPLLQASCGGAGGTAGMGCHFGSPPTASLLFDEVDNAYEELTGLKRPERRSCGEGEDYVVPGDAEGSFLFIKLSGEPPAGCGDRMPRGGMLEADEIATIREWIEDGADN